MTDDPFKRELTAAWESGARHYDAAPRHGILHPDERAAWRRLVAAVLGDPSHADVPRLRVLDVGTGTGMLALLAAELGHEVTGVDLSQAMLAEARRKSLDSGLAVDWRIGDAEALPVDLVGFDAVICRHLLWTLPQPATALAGWCAATRPGGLVAVIDGVHPRRRPPASWVADAARVIQRWQEARSGEHRHDYSPETLRRLPLGRQADTRAVDALMREAGLDHVRIRWLAEVDRVERGHLPVLARLGDGWQRYLATGRVPS